MLNVWTVDLCCEMSEFLLFRANFRGGTCVLAGTKLRTVPQFFHFVHKLSLFIIL